MKKSYLFTVTGEGSNFPVDMLRYDRCWPATTDDAIAIVNEPREVRMGSNQYPTQDRWTSFGWQITDITKVGS